jgi:hypothetical protein
MLSIISITILTCNESQNMSLLTTIHPNAKPESSVGELVVNGNFTDSTIGAWKKNLLAVIGLYLV